MKLRKRSYEGPAEYGAFRIIASLRDAVLLVCGMRNESYPGAMEVIRGQTDHLPRLFTTCLGEKDINMGFEDRLRESLERVRRLHPSKEIFVTLTQSTQLLQPNLSGRVLGINPYSQCEYGACQQTLLQLYQESQAVRGPGGDVNILGPAHLGFRYQDDLGNMRALLDAFGITVNLVYPLDAAVSDIGQARRAKGNICLPVETCLALARQLEADHGQPTLLLPPVGLEQTMAYVTRLCHMTGKPAPSFSDLQHEYDTLFAGLKGDGQRIVLAGDASHIIPLGDALSQLNYSVVRICHSSVPVEADVHQTDDAFQIARIAQKVKPSMILGTQHEMPLARMLGTRFAMVSGPGQTRQGAFANQSFIGQKGFCNLATLCKEINACAPLHGTQPKYF
ncbi:MAG: nitrogenase component 1 [Nanobdellota archaeon]